MHFDLVRPCVDCPFRSDRRFYLRRERVREILGDRRARGAAFWPAPSFPCHHTIEYGMGDDGADVIPPNAQQCAGVMIILWREHLPNEAMQLAERFKLFDPTRLDMSAPVYLTRDDAVAAGD